MSWIGLQIEGPLLKWAKISRKKEEICIEQLRTVPLAKDVKQLYFSGKDSSFLPTISGLDSSEVLLRELDFPFANPKKIKKLLPFQIESQIPYPKEEATIAMRFYPQSISFFKKKTSSQTKVSFFATKSQTLSAHISAFEEYQITPDEVSCVPAALERFCHLFLPDLTNALLFHIGNETSTALYLENRKSVFSHAFSLGVDLFSEGLAKEKELDRLFSFLLKKIKVENNEPITVILTGNFSTYPKFKELFSLRLPSELQLKELLVFHKGQEIYDSTTLAAYAIPIGLALEGLIENGEGIKFRQGPFLAKPVILRRKKAFLSFFLASACLILTTLFCGKVYLTQKEKRVLKQFNGHFNTFLGEDSSAENLQELKKKLPILERSLKKGKSSYLLKSPLPLVSETLAYLSTYEKLTDACIDIKKIEYELLEYPHTDLPKASYIGKINLEVEIVTEEEAKAFEAFLQKDRSPLDKGKEILIENRNSFYFFSFFLKPGLS